MALTVTHPFVVNIADDPKAAAAGEVLPSHWNASHTVTGTPDGVRTILSADTSFYVSTTGSDSNDGLTSGTAFATFQHAIDHISTKIDAAGFYPIIQFEDGSYPGCIITTNPVGAPGLVFRGHAADYTAVKITYNNAGSGLCIDIETADIGVWFDNITIDTGGGATLAGVWAAFPMNLNVADPRFSAGAHDLGFINSSSPTDSGMCFGFAGNFALLTNYNTIHVSGNHQAFIDSQAFNYFLNVGTVSVTGTPHFSLGFFYMFGGQIENDGTISGAATGLKALIASQAVLDIGSGVVPGDTWTGGLVNGILGANASETPSVGQFFQGTKIPGGATTAYVQTNNFAVVKDTTGGGVSLVYNDAGTLKSVALTT